jgi:hypothetical protein
MSAKEDPMDIRAAIVILVGIGTILLITQMMFLASRTLPSKAESNLLRIWLGFCCICLFILVVVPGAIEYFGLMPSCSISLAGAILFFLIVVRSSRWYLHHLAKLRTSNQFENNGENTL